ncbi:cadherin-like beta sandwich domain-containing protein [Candidatus Saccharibacteria bacterium]|nr:cadherin-like beta sandwich domain-containing protein [Candidatus Saccharibacteria bacterium]
MKLRRNYFWRILTLSFSSLALLFGTTFLFAPKASNATSSESFSYSKPDDASIFSIFTSRVTDEEDESSSETPPLENYELEPPSEDEPEIVSEDIIALSSSVGDFLEDFSEDRQEYFQVVESSVSSVTLTATIRAFTAEGEEFNYEKAETFDLIPGRNDLVFDVSSANGLSETFTARVERLPLESEVIVTNISPNVGSLSPVFDTATTDYVLSVENSVETVTLTITYEIDGTTGTWVTTKSNLTPGGQTPFTFNFNDVSYKVTIERAAAPTQTYPEVLVNLYPGVGRFNEAFSASRTTYTMNVDYNTTAVTIIAEIRASDGVTTYLHAGTAENLNTGTTEVTYNIAGVTDLSMNVVISITRAESPVSADASEKYVYVNNNLATKNTTTDLYDYTIPWNIEDATIQIVANDSSASVSPAIVNISLSEGGSSVQTFTITSSDGTKTNTIRVRVERDHHPLSSDNTIRQLSINGDVVAEEDGTFTYSYTNDSGDANLVILMNDDTASISGGTIQYNNIQEGVTITITLTATAEDGSQRTYTVNITRNAEPVRPTLTDFRPTRTDLSFVEEFDPDRDSYTLNVDYETDSVELIAILSNGIEKTVILSPLIVGSNSVTVTIEGTGNTEFYKEISVTINRAAPPTSTDTGLSSISVNGSVLTPNADGTYSYELSYNTSEAEVIVTPSDTNASVSPSARESLTVARGESLTRVYTITAEDGVTTETYSLTLTRPAAHFEIEGIDVSHAENVTKVSDTFYTATLPEDIDLVHIIVRKKYDFQTISISANDVEIAEGETKTFTIRVTDTNVDDYRDITLEVTRRAHIPNEDTSLAFVKVNEETISPDADGIYRKELEWNVETAVVTVSATDPLASVEPSSRTLSLAEGESRTVTFEVTAENPAISRTYTVVVSRKQKIRSSDNSIKTVVVNGEEIAPNPDGTYSATIDADTPSATITVSANDPDADVSPRTQTLSLDEGSTRTTTITITAENGDERTYTISLTRGQHEEPDDPEDPVDPEDPEDPENPENPDGPEDPETPVEPTTPTTPVTPDNPAPSSPSRPTGPTTPNTGNITIRPLFSRETLSPLVIFSSFLTLLGLVGRKLAKKEKA